MKPTHLLAILLTLSCLAMAHADDGVSFARTYKDGEKAVYTESQKSHLLQDNTMTVDITLTAKKILDQGRAELLFHWSNLQTTDQTTLPADITISTGANNLPASYTPTKGSMDFTGVWLLLASSTAEKTVKVGDEVPLSWDSGSEFGSFKGTIKILEITPEKKRLKASIKVTWISAGQNLAELTFRSNYDTKDFSLVDSTGTVTNDASGGPNFATQVTFTRKTE